MELDTDQLQSAFSQRLVGVVEVARLAAGRLRRAAPSYSWAASAAAAPRSGTWSRVDRHRCAGPR